VDKTEEKYTFPELVEVASKAARKDISLSDLEAYLGRLKEAKAPKKVAKKEE
jgi:hypothetical protein